MPEGPHIRNTADNLREALLGRSVEGFRSSLKKAAAEAWQEKIQGHLVTEVRSHGKNLFIAFDSGYVLYSHMMMWGSWHVHRRGEVWRKEERKARVVLETAEHEVVLFSAPVIELLSPEEQATHRTALLGPDFLQEGFGDREIAEIRRRLLLHPDMAVGEVLLDQTTMAGIGNILKSEILFRSGINPLRKSGSLTDEEFARVMEVSLDFMQRSYETRGFAKVFLPPELREKVKKLGYVYGRSKQPCFVCGTPVVMVRQGPARRATYYCPSCQPDVQV